MLVDYHLVDIDSKSVLVIVRPGLSTVAKIHPGTLPATPILAAQFALWSSYWTITNRVLSAWIFWVYAIVTSEYNCYSSHCLLTGSSTALVCSCCYIPDGSIRFLWILMLKFSSFHPILVVAIVVVVYPNNGIVYFFQVAVYLKGFKSIAHNFFLIDHFFQYCQQDLCVTYLFVVSLDNSIWVICYLEVKFSLGDTICCKRYCLIRKLLLMGSKGHQKLESCLYSKNN